MSPQYDQFVRNWRRCVFRISPPLSRFFFLILPIPDGHAALCNFVGGGGMIAISSLYALFDKQIKIPWNPDSRGKFSIKFLCYCLTVRWRTVCFRTWKSLGTFWLLFSIGLCFPVVFVDEIVGPIRGFCLYYKTRYKAFGTSSFILMDSRAIWRYSIKGFSSPPVRIRNMWNYGRKNE